MKATTRIFMAAASAGLTAVFFYGKLPVVSGSWVASAVVAAIIVTLSTYLVVWMEKK